MQVLVVDNYDSFVFNLVQYLGQLGVHAHVWRNDDDRLATDADVAKAAEHFDGVLLSPGPGTPERAGASIPLVKACAAARTPLLGVCLGHQAIGEALGARIDRGPEPVHGKASAIHHDGVGILAGLPNPFDAGRYHSLVVARDDLPDDLEVTAWTDDGVVMAVQHRRLPRFGLQFHPESILTPEGPRIVENFLALTPRRVAAAVADRPGAGEAGRR
jgi:para-aminobenzoate synthetase component II